MSRLLEQVEAGERIVIARAGKPVADLVPHHRVTIEYGSLIHELQYRDEDFEGIDDDVQDCFTDPMQLLLDTQIALWLLTDDRRLSQRHEEPSPRRQPFTCRRRASSRSPSRSMLDKLTVRDDLTGHLEDVGLSLLPVDHMAR